MTTIIVEIMVKVMAILGIATKGLHHGRLRELISRGFYDSVTTRLRSTQPRQGNIFGLRVVLLLLKHLPVDVRALWSHQTPSFSAAQRDQTGIGQYLLNHGADVNTQKEGDYAPLHLAALFIQVKFIRFLLDHGAYPHARQQEPKGVEGGFL